MAINFLDYTEKLCSGIGRNTIISILLWVCRYFTWVPPYFIVNKFKFSLTSNFSKIVSKESITTSHFFMALLLSIVWEKGESYKLILNLSLVSLHGHARHWWFGGGYYWKAWPDRILACNLGSDWHHIQPPPHHPAPTFGIIVPIMVSNRRKKGKVTKKWFGHCRKIPRAWGFYYLK